MESQSLRDMGELLRRSLTISKDLNVLDVGCQECKVELDTWFAQAASMKRETLVRIEEVTASDNNNNRMEKQALRGTYGKEMQALEAKYEQNKEELRTVHEEKKVALKHEMEREMKTRGLFLKLAKKKKKKKKAIETKYENRRGALENQYKTRHKTLEMEHAKSLSTLEVDYATRQSALDALYIQKQEIMERATDYWTGEAMEELMEDIKDQIKLLELHLGGPRSTRGNHHSNDGITSLVVCPIGGNIMVDPVMAADGYTYERRKIEDYLEKTPNDCDLISPVTGKPLAHHRLVPNQSVEAVASQYA
eukprot:CAMPEP_0116843084 /NCGR_PEP_ID=MMETSP0418-20121206/11886_1 /TAXON_ID=1158023 /ORGANISM="Astrosyne radiata, Strain 13vi08-1A" /LENGTH=306 /DNA_ID=CAMNT_0004473787 /DNA_START=123 /DNA_END=1043 /DNA_ORIENTATION=-